MDKLAARMCTTFWVITLALSASRGVTPATKDSVARSEAAVRQAQQMLGNSKGGALELQSARDGLDQAKQAIEDSADEQAVRLAHEATLHAELAKAKSRSATAREVAEDVRTGLETLRQEAQGSRKRVR